MLIVTRFLLIVSLLFCLCVLKNIYIFLKVAPYLLVASLPGEVEEAGGEELIFGPAVSVHGGASLVWSGWSRAVADENVAVQLWRVSPVKASLRRTSSPAPPAPLSSPSDAVAAI